MKLSHLIFFALVGCSNVVPYSGPPGPVFMDGREWLWLDMNGKLRRETTQLITNPGFEARDRILDCDPHPKALRRWPGTRLTLHLPPRTTTSVLLNPSDHLCSLLPVEADEPEKW